MWIVPKTLSAYALEYAESSEVLNEQAYQLESSLMWRSKPFQSSTWSRRWNRVCWIRHLFGRILRHSTASHFVERYTESLVDIRASRSASLGNGKDKKILDTFGRLYAKLSAQLTLFGASLKMCQDTLTWDSATFTKTFDLWVIQLRQDYSRRQKLARLTSDNDCSSWPTPQAQMERGTQFGKPQLPLMVHNWETPTVSQGGHTRKDGTIRPKLDQQVKNWSTPTARDVTGTDSTTDRARKSPGLPCQVGQLDQDNHKTNGKSRARLNPAWVAQLMGTTLEQIYFAPLAMQSSSKQLARHGNHYSQIKHISCQDSKTKR